MRRIFSVVLSIGLLGTAGILLTRTTIGPISGPFPVAVGSSAVLTIRDAIQSTNAGDTVTVSGFLVLDRGACGHSVGKSGGDCSGAFLWEMPVPDPWYGGSRLSLALDDVTTRLGPALGIRDWGVPIVATGTLFDRSCPSSDKCIGSMRLDRIEWVGEPVPAEFTGDPLSDRPSIAVGSTKFVIPPSWTATLAGDHWIISPMGGEVTMMLRKRDSRIVVDPTSSAWGAYPDALSIVYEHGNGIVVWKVETGATTAKRQTTVGYDDGAATYELNLSWVEAGMWIGASQYALTRIVDAMTAQPEETSL